MLSKKLIKFNIQILKNEKDRLNRAIEHCTNAYSEPSDFTKKHIENMKRKVIDIDLIIEYYNNL